MPWPNPICHNNVEVGTSTKKGDQLPILVHLLWITGRLFGQDLCQTTQIQVANALKKIGWKVSFVAPEGRETAQFVNNEGHEFVSGIKNYPITGFKSLSFERSLRRKLPSIIASILPDVIVCDWRGARGAWKAIQAARIPWAMVDRGPPAYATPLAKLQWLHYRRAWKTAGRRADACFVVSKAHGEYVEEKFSIKMPIIPLSAAADSSTFTMPNNDRRSSGKAGTDRSVKLVYHGRLDRSRGVGDLVLIADQLLHSGVETELLLFGSGSAQKRLIRQAKKYPWLTVLPPQPYSQVPELLADCDIGLLPMGNRMVWRTASPLKLFEYAASGIPVVATNIQAHQLDGEPEWIGLVPIHQRVDGMVRKIQTWVLEDRLIELGEMARNELCQRYTWSHAVEPAIEALTQLVANYSHNDS